MGESAELCNFGKEHQYGSERKIIISLKQKLMLTNLSLTDFKTIRNQFKRSGPTLLVTDFNLVILLIPSLQALYKTINVLIVT